MFDQHPGRAFHGSPVPSAMPVGTNGTQTQNDPPTCTYFGADQVILDPQMGAPINSHPRVRSSEAVNDATVFPPRTRELCACLLGHMVR